MATSFGVTSGAAVMVVLLSLSLATADAKWMAPKRCKLAKSLQAEIKGYRPLVNRVITYIRDQGYKRRTWSELARFSDMFGSRLASTSNLENSIDYMLDRLRMEHLDNVHSERISFTGWQRLKESAWLIQPREKKLEILGLGYSVPTPLGGIIAEVVVVTSFQDLDDQSLKVKGKIVVFNQPYESYSKTVEYRVSGASAASKYGAVAALVRSVTPFSMNTPHAGMQTYAEDVEKIPVASITVEDAELMHRMYKIGIKLKIFLKMESVFLPNSTSRNTIAELKGLTKPEEIVLVSGHLDSWDVGQGAMDDGGGSFISWNSLVAMKKLGLEPKRTIRCLLWTAEEEGYLGAKAYLKAHKSELNKFNLVIESDEGTFKPYGIKFHGSDTAACIMKEIAQLFDSINATVMQTTNDYVSSDIAIFQELNVPGATLLNRNDKYFWYHHTEADTMLIEDPDMLDLNTAMFAVISYIVADLSVELPRS